MLDSIDVLPLGDISQFALELNCREISRPCESSLGAWIGPSSPQAQEKEVPESRQPSKFGKHLTRFICEIG